MREKYAEVVPVTGISDFVLEKVLDFIYAGSVSMTTDTVCDLLEGTEYTQVDGELIILNVRPARWFYFLEIMYFGGRSRKRLFKAHSGLLTLSVKTTLGYLGMLRDYSISNLNESRICKTAIYVKR